MGWKSVRQPEQYALIKTVLLGNEREFDASGYIKIGKLEDFNPNREM